MPGWGETLFGASKKPDPKEQVREWKSAIRGEIRLLDRQIRSQSRVLFCAVIIGPMLTDYLFTVALFIVSAEIEREEESVKASLKKEAKNNNVI